MDQVVIEEIDGNDIPESKQYFQFMCYLIQEIILKNFLGELLEFIISEPRFKEEAPTCSKLLSKGKNESG